MWGQFHGVEQIVAVSVLTYTMKDGCRLPDLLPPQEPETALGKYGLLRRKYLKAHRKVLFTNLLTYGAGEIKPCPDRLGNSF